MHSYQQRKDLKNTRKYIQPVARGFLNTLTANYKHMVYKLYRSWYICTIESDVIGYAICIK